MADNNPELNDPKSRVPFIIGLTVGLTSLSTILTSLRLYTRTVVLHTAGLDDVAVAVAQFLTIGLAIATCLEAHFGLGRHMGLLTEEELVSQAKSLFAAIQTYIWGLCIIKVAFLLQYRRIFNVIWIRKAALGVIAFSVTWNILQSTLCSLACVPIALFVPSRQGRCIDSLPVWLTAAGINIITDFIVFALPLPAIKSLHLPMKQKILLSGVVCLGFFTCIVSIVRLPALHLVMKSPDTSWTGQGAAVWSVVEINCAISCACLPMLKPLISRLLPGLLTHRRMSTYERWESHPAGSYALSPRKKTSNRAGSTEALDPLERAVYGNTHDVSINGYQGKMGPGTEEIDAHTTEYPQIHVITEMVITEET
ncbi:Satratoxin biosynthesis SC1 cluster protein 4 [Fusarium oxysporum f. sp. raphani]|uniref:Satratoxin biosynthesis SC1 cluster protein 4 n=1 Tax=Fusarium oxysporum f. sp. raphani TaxID=96318 RepID=A0A8J5P118_FUSOX|nr:Satratoxin biosynthesis SC1 cluster protein 4 [Fusarium oxysporum f. sp. raphani]